jgi:hypothetical protein
MPKLEAASDASHRATTPPDSCNFPFWTFDDGGGLDFAGAEWAASVHPIDHRRYRATLTDGQKPKRARKMSEGRPTCCLGGSATVSQCQSLAASLAAAPISAEALPNASRTDRNTLHVIETGAKRATGSRPSMDSAPQPRPVRFILSGPTATTLGRWQGPFASRSASLLAARGASDGGPLNPVANASDRVWRGPAPRSLIRRRPLHLVWPCSWLARGCGWRMAVLDRRATSGAQE